MNPQAAYDELTRRSKDETLSLSCSSLVGSEERPTCRGGEPRIAATRSATALHHERRRSRGSVELLEMLEGSERSTTRTVAAVNLQIRPGYDRDQPRTLVEELARRPRWPAGMRRRPGGTTSRVPALARRSSTWNSAERRSSRTRTVASTPCSMRPGATTWRSRGCWRCGASWSPGRGDPRRAGSGPTRPCWRATSYPTDRRRVFAGR